MCDCLKQNLGHYNKATVLIPGLLPRNVTEPKENSALGAAGFVSEGVGEDWESSTNRHLL